MAIRAPGLAERLGGRRVFTTVLFGAASAVCGLAPTLGALVAARLVQGIGAAVLVPSSLLLRAGLVVAGCAFLAGAALVGGGLAGG